jgi:murein L,D-transpeptidase YcbB/YkuD
MVPFRTAAAQPASGAATCASLARGLVALALAALACADRPPVAPAAADAQPLPSQIRAALADPGGRALGEPLHEPETLSRFYAARGDQPAWWRGDASARARARLLLEAVRGSLRHGLRPEAYHAGALAHWLESGASADAQRLAGLDLLLSDAFVHLARHLAGGAVDPRSLHPRYQRAGGPPPDPASALASAVESGAIAEELERLAPPHPEYAGLVRALERLRADPTARARVDQVRINLERWRWLPRDLGRRHLRINTPAFALHAYDGGNAVLAMRVVVGEPDWTTPLAHGVVQHLVLNPAWQVPHSIATREMLPAARRDPGYFRAKGIQVLLDQKNGEPREVDPRRVDWKAVQPRSFPYRLRQRPGPKNPLGRIKFIFPNPYGVYLHGTPGDAAFDRPARTLSHGCVRVEDEIALAAFALAPDPKWTRERLLESLRSAWEHRIPLPAPLPVHLLYLTASAGPDGTAAFTRDPYGWDAALLGALGPDPAAEMPGASRAEPAAGAGGPPGASPGRRPRRPRSSAADSPPPEPRRRWLRARRSRG